MTIEHFTKYYKPQMQEYCPVLIMPDGNIFDCSAGHMQMLRSISSEEVMQSIPADVSPMMYLAGVHQCVIVDYENQIYMDELTPEQVHVLEQLVCAGLICDHRVRMTHESIRL